MSATSVTVSAGIMANVSASREAARQSSGMRAAHGPRMRERLSHDLQPAAAMDQRGVAQAPGESPPTRYCTVIVPVMPRKKCTEQ